MAFFSSLNPLFHKRQECVIISAMQFTPGPLEGLMIIEPKVFGDDRGYFYESYLKPKFVEAGITEEFVQDNQSFSEKNIVRGLHFQKPPHAQSKLIRALSGEVYDVAVDMRPDSPTFGKWFGIYLSAENHKIFYIPHGFAHGFCVTSDSATLLYKCGDVYNKEAENGVRWDDAELNIDWPIDRSKVILSDKDAELKTFSEIKKELIW